MRDRIYEKKQTLTADAVKAKTESIELHPTRLFLLNDHNVELTQIAQISNINGYMIYKKSNLCTSL